MVQVERSEEGQLVSVSLKVTVDPAVATPQNHGQGEGSEYGVMGCGLFVVGGELLVVGDVNGFSVEMVSPSILLSPPPMVLIINGNQDRDLTTCLVPMRKTLGSVY